MQAAREGCTVRMGPILALVSETKSALEEEEKVVTVKLKEEVDETLRQLEKTSLTSLRSETEVL